MLLGKFKHVEENYCGRLPRFLSDFISKKKLYVRKILPMTDARTLNNARCKTLLGYTHCIPVLFANLSHEFRDSENLNLIL